MKTILHKTLTTAFVLMLAVTALNAQSSKLTWRYGITPEDSLECLKNQSLYGQYFTQNSFDLAITYWRQNYNFCPASSTNVYVRGQKMYESFFEKTNDKAYIDTLMMILDKKAYYYGNQPDADFRKSFILSRYISKYPVLLQDAYKLIDQYVKNEPALLTSDAMVVHMNNSVNLYRTKKLTQDEVINNYSKMMAVIDKQLAAAPADQNIASARGMIENFFRTSGVATCDNLIPLFSKQVSENPTDTELLRKVAGLLQNAGCTDSELYFKAVDNLYKLEKTASSANHLAEMSVAKEEFDKAEKYYLEAVELESDPLYKSNYLTKLATLEISAKDFVKARDYAKMAIDFNPNSGSAHYIIGSAYTAAKIGEDDFETRTVFWIAADYFIKAKNLDPSLTDSANENIAICAANFPKKDDAFFVGILLEEGAPYTVKGWINERTTVRYRK
jgi:tetratricopeptide (TPR) repeat protein